MSVFRRIDHVEIIPSDLDRSLAFYMGVLGFTLRDRWTVGVPPLRDVLFLELGDTMLEVLEFDDPAPPAVVEGPRVGYRMMALEVDSMDDALAYLAERGIEPTRPPYPSGTGLRAEIVDPDGLAIEVRQWGATPA
ncbi:MAG: VOC family protein [Thermoleophilia bacterium]